MLQCSSVVSSDAMGAGAHDATLAERNQVLTEEKQRRTAAETQAADMRDKLNNAQVILAHNKHELDVSHQAMGAELKGYASCPQPGFLYGICPGFICCIRQLAKLPCASSEQLALPIFGMLMPLCASGSPYHNGC